MSNLKIIKNFNEINGLAIIETNLVEETVNSCEEEVYNQREFYKAGINDYFIQENEVFSKKGVLRGMHVNIQHPQAKLIRVIKGKIYDVVVDLRKQSKTFKKCFGIELSKENKKQLYIPCGMGHGYLALEDSIVIFKTTRHYIPNDEIGFSWKSQELEIEWPIEGLNLIQNERDCRSIDISELKFGDKE